MSLDAPADPWLFVLAAVLYSVAAALAFSPRFAAMASRVALPALLLQLAVTFPLTYNHFFLELYAVTILALADADGRDDALALAGLRWLTAIVLFHTGWQKLAYGHYWSGDFLAFMVGRGDRFADLFQWMLPAPEVARLASYDPFRNGSGPFRVSTPLFVVLANAVWVAEVALPIGLLVRRTRPLAALVALAFVLLIQLGAREVGFALLFANLLLTFAPLAVAERLSVLSLALVACIPPLALGSETGSAFVRTWHLW